jgi:hypothetical protein
MSLSRRSVDTLESVSPHSREVLTGNFDDDALGCCARRLEAAGVICAVVLGEQCRTEEEFFNMIGNALELPEYFGHNWPALRECLSEDDRLIDGRGFFLAIQHAELAFERSIGSRDAFMRCMELSGQSLSADFGEGEWWFRAPRGLIILLSFSPASPHWGV